MRWKLNKKILIGSIALVGALSLTALVVTSCSATPSPTFPIIAQVGGHTFTIQNGRVTSSAIVVDGESYTSPPNFNKDDVKTQQARAVYDLITNFSVWLYGSSNSLSTFISRMPTTKNRPNPVLEETKDLGGLDYALSSFLGSGAGTYQLGIRTIKFDDITPEIINGVKKYNDTDLVNDEPVDNKLEITIPNIAIEYGWWRTEGGSKISWIDANQFNSISKNSFSNSLNGVADAKQTYTLALQNISFEVTRYAQNAEKKWFPNGVLTIAPTDSAKSLPFYFGTSASEILDGTAGKKLFDEINEANKAASGDYSDRSFKQVLTNFKDLVPNFNKILK